MCTMYMLLMIIFYPVTKPGIHDTIFDHYKAVIAIFIPLWLLISVYYVYLEYDLKLLELPS